jgi:hypothetical protein
MGANQSSVDILCFVDKLSHAPGETIKGVVLLKVKGQPLTHFDGVTVTLAGAELLVLDDSRIRGSMGKRIKLKQDITKFDEGVIPEGEHEFPFELDLPDHHADEREAVPDMEASITSVESSSSSDSLSSSSYVSKQIVYKLRASLRRKENVSLNSDTNYWCDAKCADLAAH